MNGDHIGGGAHLAEDCFLQILSRVCNIQSILDRLHKGACFLGLKYSANEKSDGVEAGCIPQLPDCILVVADSPLLLLVQGRPQQAAEP